MKLAIAETFHSIMGEGTWVGTPMHFIRTAGCSVGRPYTNRVENLSSTKDNPQLPTGALAWECHTWDGRSFWCDTDFNKRLEVETDDLVDVTFEDHICLTGGEPLIHRLAIERLVELAFFKRKTVHIETSGTIFFPHTQGVWLTVAPKQGALASMLDSADEIKLLVDKDFKVDNVPAALHQRHNVFLSPVNDVDQINKPNLQLALDILTVMPNWRLSTQVHKWWGVR